MEMKEMIKIAIVVIISVLFITESFYFGGGFFKASTPEGTTGVNVSGTALFNGTIRTYDPLLLIDANTSSSVLDQVRSHQGVSAVRTDPRYPEYLIVDAETRDDVFPTAEWLREMNVSSLSVANIAVNRDIPVETAAGMVNATLQGGVVRVVAEPLLDSDSEVTVAMMVVLNSNQIIDYNSAQLVVQQMDLLLDAVVSSLEGTVYSYRIPWQDRNSLGDLGAYEAVDFNRVDSVIFSPQLTVEQIMIKKQFSYVSYIDASSAQVEPSFDNLTQLQANFADVNYTLPDSTLVIMTNGTEPDIPFTPQVSYDYVFRIQNSTFDFGADEYLPIETGAEYDVNSTVRLNVSVSALGDEIISVRRVSLLPS